MRCKWYHKAPPNQYFRRHKTPRHQPWCYKSTSRAAWRTLAIPVPDSSGKDTAACDLRCEAFLSPCPDALPSARVSACKCRQTSSLLLSPDDRLSRYWIMGCETNGTFCEPCQRADYQSQSSRDPARPTTYQGSAARRDPLQGDRTKTSYLTSF